MTNNNQEEICCPKFDPKPWDNKTFEWKNKKFIKDKVFTLFYMPINYGQVMTRLTKKIGKVEMCLSEHTSMWNMNIYAAVDKEIPGAENITLSGKLVSKVYEGGYEKMGEWIKDFEKIAKVKYMWYTTCPKCAKKYGKNYVVIMGNKNAII